MTSSSSPSSWARPSGGPNNDRFNALQCTTFVHASVCTPMIDHPPSDRTCVRNGALYTQSACGLVCRAGVKERASAFRHVPSTISPDSFRRHSYEIYGHLIHTVLGPIYIDGVDPCGASVSRMSSCSRCSVEDSSSTSRTSRPSDDDDETGPAPSGPARSSRPPGLAHRARALGN